MGNFIHIRSSKFPILPGEEAELVNDGLYGKALALYLQEKLNQHGCDSPFICCEDWGWWVELMTAPFALGICIYCINVDDAASEFVCTDSILGPRKWSWKRFWFMDTAPWVKQVHETLVNIFQSDQEVQIVEITDEFPSAT